MSNHLKQFLRLDRDGCALAAQANAPHFALALETIRSGVQRVIEQLLAGRVRCGSKWMARAEPSCFGPISIPGLSNLWLQTVEFQLFLSMNASKLQVGNAQAGLFSLKMAC